MAGEIEWTRVWVWTARCQDIRRRVWCRYVWRTHISILSGSQFQQAAGCYVYRYYEPIP